MTKNFITILILFISKVSSGQQLFCKSQAIDSLLISSASGYYHFEKGANIGNTDYLHINFSKKENKYLVEHYKKERFKFYFRSEKKIKKVKFKKNFAGNITETKHIDSLINSFNKDQIIPTFSNLGLSQNAFLNLTSEKNIRRIAKHYKSDWVFKKRYTTKEENVKLFKACQSIDSLNLFLRQEFNETGYPFLTDAWDETAIVFYSKGKMIFEYEGKYPNIYKQPWYDFSDSTKNAGVSILNFHINQYLLKILPKDFNQIDDIKIEALINSYIVWFLKRQDIIS